MTIFICIFLLGLCCNFKWPSAQSAVVLGMQEGIKVLLKWCHCNGGKWLMKGEGCWLHLFLFVSTNVCSLSENSACFWEGSQQWVSLAKWAILPIWSDLKSVFAVRLRCWRRSEENDLCSLCNTNYKKWN